MERKHWWRGRKKEAVLMVMHLADMHRVHPQTDYSHVCSRCGGPVGIYPSGQRIVRKFKTTIICNRCQQPDQRCQPAPGAMSEVGQSRPVSRG